MTYSIVALDPETGELGIGVQTHQLAVGALVPWVKAGVGAVATQSFARASIGPQILSLLENGMSATQAVDAVMSADSAAVLRQVAVIHRGGEVAVHTGDACTPFAGHHIGRDYAVQANMMRRETVPRAMAKAFEFAQGPLAVRILHALEAAEAEGGDLRGAQSAALIVRGDGSADENRHWDFRVDNDPDPLARLRELVTMRLAIRLAQGSGRMIAPADDPNQALAEALAAFEQSQRLAPSDETTFWFAVQTLAGDIGAVAQAGTLLDALFQRAPQWRELLHRLPMLRTPSLLERFPRDAS